MQKIRFYYLVQVQFLGFRYSGWQKQPGQKTVEGMLHKTLKFILPESKFKILGVGRTDAKVSALDYKFELFLENKPIQNQEDFIELFNLNLPPDIRIMHISEIDNRFNIIQHTKYKEYIYLFSFGKKNHPFCAPFLANILEDLDIDLMKKTANLFVGTHHFEAYTARPRRGTRFERTINSCEIIENELLVANFFPEVSYALRVEGAGFLRYQIRMIMGALILVGKGALTFDQVQNSLKKDSPVKISKIAPASGLLLHSVKFD